MTEKMKFETKDLTQENIAKIGQLFPEVLTEAKDGNGILKKVINFDKLRQILSDSAIDNRETYDFTWVGKKQAILEAATPIRKTLRPCKEESVNWDTTQNLYIEGDNLDVLKLLQESYLGKVKMIYIDPPYNTGKDFIYKDDFTMSKEKYDESGERLDEEGNRLVKNTDANGRFHSDWCSMMYPRLKLARNLLTDDGVIFISIDEHELNNLSKLCDEIFGRNNLISSFVWQKKSGGGQAKYFYEGHEYIIIYAKDKSKMVPFIKNKLLTLDESKILQENGRFFYMEDDFLRKVHGKYTGGVERRCHYEDIESIKGLDKKKEIDKGIEEGIYDLLLDEKENKHFVRRKTEIYKIQNKYFKHTLTYSLIQGIWNSSGTEEIERLFDGKVLFTNPKPTLLIQELVSYVSGTDFIILDFFSGSATTANAIMKLNVENGGNRKYILVQLPENLDDNLKKVSNNEEKKAIGNAIKLCDEINVPHLLTEIGKERIRRAAKKIKEEHPESNFDGGFRVFKLADSNMKEVYFSPNEYRQDFLDKMTSNIKEDRNAMDLLYGCMLEWGLPLSYPHTSEKVGSYTIHTVNNGDLMACFDENVTEDIIRHIAAKKPLRVVFRDAGFADSPAKINVGELFKLHSPDSKVKVI